MRGSFRKSENYIKTESFPTHVMSKASDMRQALKAIQFLQVLKRQKTLSELSFELEIPVPVLSKYINERNLPPKERTEKIFEMYMSQFNLEDEIRRRIKVDEHGFIGNFAMNCDVNLLDFIADKALELYSSYDLNKVLTPATDGIPLSVLVAKKLSCQLLVAKRGKEVGVERFKEISYGRSSGIFKTVYVPEELLQKTDKILIVDDIIYSANTQIALIDLSQKVGASVRGVFSPIVFQKGVDALQARDIPVEYILKID